MRKLTKEDIVERLEANDRGIILVGEYINTGTKTLFRCQYGHEWSAQPNNIMNGQGCPSCANNQKLTSENMRDWLVKNGRGITLVGEYLGAFKKTTFMCEHNHVWNTTPHSLKAGSGCIKCSGKYRPTTEEFRKWLIEDGRGITLIEEYVNKSTRVMFQCKNGHQWRASPHNIKRGRGCPVCADHSGGGFNPEKSATVYAFTRENYLKIGITNNLQRRLKEHRRHGEINLVYQRYYSVGYDAKNFEIKFMQTHGGHHVTKEECPDGWTETYPIDLITELIKDKING